MKNKKCIITSFSALSTIRKSGTSMKSGEINRGPTDPLGAEKSLPEERPHDPVISLEITTRTWGIHIGDDPPEPFRAWYTSTEMIPNIPPERTPWRKH
ncbi:hypothetical protein JTB14_002077 [Gonioctena quinquepunctata]|nr:hypothetical protein JTB14_002077 [Gonioctena quinquepunctata]